MTSYLSGKCCQSPFANRDNIKPNAKSRKDFTFNHSWYSRKKVNYTEVLTYKGKYPGMYLPLGVFTFLPTGILPILVRIFKISDPKQQPM